MSDNLPLTDWDKMVCKELAKTDRLIKEGKLETCSFQDYMRDMKQHLKKLKAQEQKQRPRPNLIRSLFHSQYA